MTNPLFQGNASFLLYKGLIEKSEVRRIYKTLIIYAIGKHSGVWGGKPQASRQSEGLGGGVGDLKNTKKS